MSEATQTNFSSSRIAKNTIALYIRSAISMLIALYCSRVLLRVLGVEDFGVYNVVGGVAMLFSFLNGALAVSSQRFMNYEMGKGNNVGVNQVFVMSVNMMTLIAVFVCVLADIVGVNLLYNHLNIPDGRFYAAEWVLHLSVLAMFITLETIPNNALIIAKEDMRTFAYVDILGSVLKLAGVLSLDFLPGDNLIMYASFIVGVQMLLAVLYLIICKVKFNEAKYFWFWDTELFKRMFGFTSWTVLASSVMVVRNQGISVLYNCFYGVLLNTAIGLATQVNNGLNTLVNNFTLSFNPQMVKNYAAKDLEHCQRLHKSGSKFSFFLHSLGALPILLNTEPILQLWLKNVPPHVVVFVRMVLISSLLKGLIATGNIVVRATGNVKWFELTAAAIEVCAFMFIYIAIKIGVNVYIPFLILIFGEVMACVYRTVKSCNCLCLSLREFMVNVQCRALMSTLIAGILSCLIHIQSEGLEILFLNVCVTVLLVAVSNYVLGLDKQERDFAKQKIMVLKDKLASRF